MALSNPIASFSVYAVSIIDPETGLPAGTPIRVLESSSLNLTGENINLIGGALRYPWEIESGDITAELALNFSEYPSYLPKFLLGADVNDSIASNGEVYNIEELVGTSISDSTNGVSGIIPLVGSEENLKATTYFLKATGTNTADLYAASDIDFSRGTAVEFIDDTLVVAQNLDLSATLDLTDFGIQIVIAGIPAFVTGDSLGFSVTPINEGGYRFEVGNPNNRFPEFRAIVYAEIASSGKMMRLDCFRCQATGMPLGFNRKQFSSSEVTVGLKYDSTRGRLFDGEQIAIP